MTSASRLLLQYPCQANARYPAHRGQSRDNRNLLHFRYTTRNRSVTRILLFKVFSARRPPRSGRQGIFQETRVHDAVLPCSAEGRRP